MKKLKIFSALLIILFGASSLSYAKLDVQITPEPLLQIEKSDTPLTLEECYRLALIRSETVGITKEEIEVAKAQFFKATGEFFGDVNFYSEELFQDGGGPGGAGGISSVGGTFTAERRRNRYFNINQPLFQGGKSFGAITGAGALKNQRKNEYIRSQQTLFQEVSNAFYDILLFQDDISTIMDIIKLFQERINELKEREDIGRSRPSEVMNAVSRMQSLEADLAVSRGRLQVARHILEFLTGITIELGRIEEQNLEGTADRSPNEYMKMAITRPDVVAAKNEVKVAWDAIIVAQSDFWPRFDLNTKSYERREGFQSAINWDMLISFNVPIFKGGETFGEFKEAISRWKQAKLRYSQTYRQAELEIKNAFENWWASYNQYKSLAEAVKSSNEDFTLQKKDYERNLVSNLDVLDALERLNSTRRQSNLAFYKMKQDYWRLKVATGETIETK